MQHVQILASSWCRVCLPGAFQVKTFRDQNTRRPGRVGRKFSRSRKLKFISTTDSLKKRLCENVFGHIWDQEPMAMGSCWN